MKRFRNVAVMSFVALAATAALSGMAAGSVRQGPGMPIHHGMMEFQQVAVAVADVNNGVALTFTTESGDTAQLRRRVQFMADMFNMQPERSVARRGGMLGAMMVSATASVEEVPNGVRLTLEPRNIADLDALRSRVRLMAGRMESSGSMTMAGMMMAGPMQLAGSDVAVSDVPDGVALMFTTESGDVTALQSRVETMAAMFDAGGTPGAARGGRGMMGRGMMLQATATVERLSDGARLTLKPADPSEIAALRMHVDHMLDMMASASGQP